MRGINLGRSIIVTKVLRIDLTGKKVTWEDIDLLTCRAYIGGLGTGARILYDEVAPGTAWDDPGNRLIFSSGPLNGTVVAGSGSFCVVTKGCLTNGATSSQANGYFGAFLRLSGFETVAIKGAAEDWTYLYVHDRKAELRSAHHLVGKDTWETEELIKKELGGKEADLSVFSIGPAGENLVKFASIVGDRGHVAAHNGVGAVMGSKKLKAIVAARGNREFEIKDMERLRELNKRMLARSKAETHEYEEGTSFLLGIHVKKGTLPVKNLTTNIFPDYHKLTGEYYRAHFDLKPQPCWRCPLKHCHMIKVTEGPYAGYVAEEPEYECFASWGPLIGQSDPGAAIMLSDTVDRLGLDTNEAGWLMAFAIECFEKGIITRSDTSGLQMTWGNVEAIKAMLHKIARREGLGDVLAEGVMRASDLIGGEASALAVYVRKGQAPRSHDHRARWLEMLDTATSDCGTIAVGPQHVENPLSPEAIVGTLLDKRVRTFVDSLVVCMFPSATMLSNKIDYLVEMLNVVSGWDYTESDAVTTGRRIDTILRAFNTRHGMTPDLEVPSPRYGSGQVDGPVKAESIMPHWGSMIDEYYRGMGWDRRTGKPLPDVLRRLGLEDMIDDLWQETGGDEIGSLRGSEG
jgi:aldehyde:ferredoxin oxidoreductase